MQESRRLWLIQNRLWLKNAAAATMLSILLLVFATRILPEPLSSWLLVASSEQPTLAEIESELAIERIRSKDLAAQFDSLKAKEQTRGSYQTVLATIRKRCDHHQVLLTEYDQVHQSGRSRSGIVSYRLLVEGRFHAMALLLSDLEALPFGVTVQSLSLENKSAGSDLIRGVFVINLGVN